MSEPRVIHEDVELAMCGMDVFGRLLSGGFAANIDLEKLGTAAGVDDVRDGRVAGFGLDVSNDDVRASGREYLGYGGAEPGPGACDQSDSTAE